jgi:putative endonuclease
MAGDSQLGSRGEEMAWRYLERQGFGLLARNWRSRRGELDLVVRQGETIVFVEVRARRSRRFGGPEEALTRAKRRSLQRAAWVYLEANHCLEADWRIDVIAIDFAVRGVRLEHYPNALEAEADLDRRA